MIRARHQTLWVRNSVIILDTGWVGNVEVVGNNLDDNKWHHIAVAGTPGDSKVQFFVDGMETTDGVVEPRAIS